MTFFKFNDRDEDIAQNFTAGEWRLFAHLRLLDPYGEKYQEIDTLSILSNCNIKKTTFYKAIAKFQELDLFDFQDKGFAFRSLGFSEETESIPKKRKTFRGEEAENFPQKRKTFRENGIDSEKTEKLSEKTECTIYKEFKISKISLDSSACEKKKDGANSLDLENALENKLANEIDLELEKENELENSLDLEKELANENSFDLEGKLELENALDLESATTKPTLSEIPETEIQSLVKSESGSVEKFSAVVSAPEKPKPKPRPQIKAWESWPPAGPWNINGQLDMNFRDAIAQSWMTAYGGDVHKKKADVLRHFKKDPDNLAIAWEQYQSEYLNRYESTQILMNNGVEIPQEYQRRLINNQRAITQSLPPEINLITAPVIPDSIGPMSSLGGVVKPLALTEAIQTTQKAERTTIKTEDGKTYQTYQKPVLENPATPEQMGEMLERIKAFTQGGRMGQRKPVVELTEEAIALEKEAKKANYLANLNEMLKDPILRKEAMKEAFKREDLEFLFDEDGSPYQVTYAEC